MEPKPISIKSLLIAAVAVVGAEFVARELITHGGVHAVFAQGLVRLFQIILLLLIVITREKSIASIGVVSSQLIAGFKKGIIWSLGFGTVTGVIFLILWAAGFQISALFQASVPIAHGEFFLFIGVGAVIAPVAEEIFFRGILYGFFRQWGLTMALAISTVLFVIPHAAGGGLPVTQLVGGLLFAVAYEIEKNLIVPITIHSLGNLAIFCLSFLAQS